MVEGARRWQATGEAEDANEVVGERHMVEAEVRDTETAPDEGRRRLSTGKCLMTHGAGENRRGGSHPRSMAAG
jgi:hypothetical protein